VYIKNLNEEDEMSANIDPNIELPVLLITANRDMVATAAVMEKEIRQFAEEVLVEELDSGHWCSLNSRMRLTKLWKTLSREFNS
jgi:predicted alpha/beta-fold hydrolase